MSLAVQSYLHNNHTLDDLATHLGINVYHHPSLPLVGLKYSQINSPKLNPVVRDCRGIVLERDTWRVVAKSFRRFFNAGEDQDAFRNFNWSDFTCTSKEDGSLILVYYYNGEWHVNTSGSFGLGECNFSGKTWRELFWETSGIDRYHLDRKMTYVFELWTPFNKVIRVYPKPIAFLLSMFDMETLAEYTVGSADIEARHIGVARPDHHHFSSMDDIAEFLADKEKTDRTYEGVVIRDNLNERYKVKSKTYLALHHLFDNGNIFNPRRLVPFILAGETAEIEAYYPEVTPHVERVKGEIDGAFDQLLALWRETWEIEAQRDFALAIVKKNPFSGLLFTLRKAHGKGQDEAALRKLWGESGEMVIKVLYG